MRMPHLAICLAALVAAALWNAQGQTPVEVAPAAAAAAPRLVCAEATFDFGSSQNTQEVRHVFVLKNEGSAPAIIERVRPGCGCTKAEASTNVIAPGGVGNVAIIFNLHGRSGPQRVATYVHSNDPQHPYLSLLVMGTAMQEVDISPLKMEFDLSGGRAPGEVSVTITNHAAALLNVTGTVVQTPFFTVRVETNEPGRSFRVFARLLTTNSPPEGMAGVLTVLTDNPNYSSMIVPVSVQSPMDLLVVPGDLKIFDRSDNLPEEFRYVIVRSARQRPFQVLDVSTTMPDTKAEIESKGEGWVRVKIGPFQVSPKLNNTTVTIHTDRPDQKAIEIPVRVLTVHPPVGSRG